MTEPGWVAHAIWWQVYPLGFAGAYPAGRENGKLERVTAWLDYAVELGAILRCPTCDQAVVRDTGRAVQHERYRHQVVDRRDQRRPLPLLEIDLGPDVADLLRAVPGG